MYMNGFKILNKLGQGSFGVVHKVQRKSDQKIYAMKQINLQKMSYEEKNNALNEVRLLASLHHSHIVKFLEAFPYSRYGGSDTTLCIVMEFADGGDISSRIKSFSRKNRRFTEATIWKYAAQLTDALQYLHSHNIMHRDIKAANCFLTKDGCIKVGDMNISKIVKNGQLAKTKIGTPYYMSPEIWKNRPYDYKCDVWSVGCLLYELATFKVPFDGYNMVYLSRKILSGMYNKRPSKHYSDSLWKYIESMLKVNPRSRSSMNELFKQAKTHIEYKESNKDKPLQLLGTIKMIQGIRQLSNRMPKPQYNKTNIPRKLPPIQENKFKYPNHKNHLQHRKLKVSKKLKDITLQPIPPYRYNYNNPYARKPVVYKKKSPVVEKKSPVIEKKSPVVEKKSPVIEKKSPVIEKKSPVVEKKSPVVEKKSRVVEKSPGKWKRPPISKLLNIHKSPTSHWPKPGFKWFT